MTAPTLTPYAPAADLLEAAAAGTAQGQPLAAVLDGAPLAARAAVYATIATMAGLPTGNCAASVDIWETATRPEFRRVAYYNAAFAIRMVTP